MTHFDTLLPDGSRATLYKICGGGLEAVVMDYGATLVSLFVPDWEGTPADVVLGYDRAWDYAVNNSNLGATVGRSANRTGGARFLLNGKRYQLSPNDHEVNNLHSGPDIYNHRMWQVAAVTDHSVTLMLHSPDGDQGYPGSADIRVTYSLPGEGVLRIAYEGVCDQDTIFNMTNHSYFNLAGHEYPEKAMEQVLMIPTAHFTPADENSIPTGEVRDVTGSPMDFREPKRIGRDIGQDYDALRLQLGYDHNYVVEGDPSAVLTDPDSGRMMAVSTDCPGLQFYSGNYLDKMGKGGVHYTYRGAVCLETQFFPNAINTPGWKQPIVRAGERYRSSTEYRFSWGK